MPKYEYSLNMTSNNTPSPYVVTASVEGSTESFVHKGYYAFDGEKDSVASEKRFWSSGGATNGLPCWIAIDFGEKKKVNFLHVYHVIDGSQSARIKNFKIQASNDNSNWIDLKTFNNELWMDIRDKRFYLDDTVEYRHYRLYITATNGNAWTTISELVFGYEYTMNKMLIKTDASYVYYGQNPTTLDNEWINLGESPTDEDWLNKGIDVVTQSQLEKLSQQEIVGRFAVKRL